MSLDNSDEKPFCVERAKTGRAACKKCKNKCASGELRIAKLMPNPFGDGKMKNWYHVDCIFEQFLKQRAATNRIESSDDIDGWDELSVEDQNDLLQKIEENEKDVAKKLGKNYTPKKLNTAKTSSKNSPTNLPSTSKQSDVPSRNVISNKDIGNGSLHDDMCFKTFRQLLANIADVDSYTEKTNIVKDFFTNGSDGQSFKGDITQWCRLLLPGDIKRIYNLQNKQLIKLFSKIFVVDQQCMTDWLNNGDIGETIERSFENSKKLKPAIKSTLLLQEVDDFLEELSQLTREDDQQKHFRSIVSKSTGHDLKIIIRLIKHDLRINAGPKHILQGVHVDAYRAYQVSKNLDAVIQHYTGGTSSQDKLVKAKPGVNIMTPIQPMLAEACKSVEQAIKKCVNGMYSEIKYDGERVQVHKQDFQFKYYSRSLKPVLPHKIKDLENYIPKAFPKGANLVLDSEILMIDTETSQPLPFGTLGSHKKNKFANANVCLFVFDCIYYNDESLIDKPLEYRKKILRENMVEIPNRIMLSKMEFIRTPKQLSCMIAEVLQLGLEGLVLKDIKGVYAPGKRHWLKVKKDYLLDGAMADSADLIVLGAWYGTGRKAGKKSVFLMGCYDEDTKLFCTVTKVHTGHDDKTLDRLQNELQLYEIGCNYDKVPNWLNCSRSMTPDFVAVDPRKQPVWEITGAEFTKHDIHTADGISIRFPRVTRIRSDKTWETATTLHELNNLFKTSKESTDFKALLNVDDDIVNNGTLDHSDSKNTNDKRKRKVTEEETLPLKRQKTSNKCDKDDNSMDDFVKIKNPLLTIFKNVQLLAEKQPQEVFQRVLRYFVAHGGIVLDPSNWLKATHVLHFKNTVTEQSIKCPKDAKHIIPEWIKDSVISKSLKDVVPYTVRLEHE